MSPIKKKAVRAAVVIALCAAAATVWFAGGADPFAATPPAPAHLPTVARPPAPQPALDAAGDAYLDTTPPRRMVGLDLIRNGWTYNCMECHRLFPAKWHYDRPMAEHQDIRLEHGNNRFCLNCHHPTNRNAFVDYDGGEIAAADVALLCGKCHGTIYRDWEAGVHGRVSGFWKADLGGKTRLRCIQCHDPHHPKFEAMKPLPPLRYPARGAHPPVHRAAEPDARVAPVKPEARGPETGAAPAAAAAAGLRRVETVS
ncbi:MAG TPA: hypothetical protein PLV05_08485 [Verrucomicrobiota bacterium]|nr:hypothetical protein [Verrucomicrobiota bacterium]HRV40226.1 hypothetical protein [Candidatus Paceibacterota bacterium]HOM46004.1 hypothetical protein [Verrucomicrobiota bacterium]HOQ56293.1 hypothetical protein [Verrucomicrobiota bacterium]HPC53123.1 hypothetical protein [Verrucomicrobiota bacterium]